MLQILWLCVLLVDVEFLLLSVNGQLEICRGCANDTKCHVFDPPTNSKYVGCYGEFDNSDSANDMQSLCAGGFKVMDVTEAVSEGFTGAMCDTAPDDTMFFLYESGYSSFGDRYCASEDELNAPAPAQFENVWGCGDVSSGSPFEDPTCGTSNFVCTIQNESVTSTYCDTNNPGVLEPPGFDFTTVQFVDGSLGGVICIREPTMAPSFMPTSVPTQPTFNPSGVPSRAPSYQPTTDPTKAPTRMPTFTRFPTNQPTTIPSKMPSNNPSTIPSYLPTEDPTSAPTPAPSNPPTTTKKVRSTEIFGVERDYLMYIGLGLLAMILFCACPLCIWGMCKKRKKNKKNESALQMSNTNQQATINTTTPAQYETDMAQFSIGNIVKTKK